MRSGRAWPNAVACRGELRGVRPLEMAESGREVLLTYNAGAAVQVASTWLGVAVITGAALWLRASLHMTDSPFFILLAACANAAMLWMVGRVVFQVALRDRAAVWLEGERLCSVFWSVPENQVESVSLKTKSPSFTTVSVVEFKLKDGSTRNIGVGLLEVVSSEALERVGRRFASA